MDYSVAWSLVESLLQQIRKMRDEANFDRLLSMCKKYTTCINEHFEDTSELQMEVDFPEKRIGKKKKMPGELTQDESNFISPTQKFKALYFNILDCAVNSIEERFVVNEDLLRDCAVLDPKNFKKMLNNFSLDMSTTSLTKLADVTKSSRSELITELKQFATNYDVFKLSLVKDRDANLSCEEQWLAGNDGSLCQIETNVKCSQCLSCAFTVLYDLSSQSGLFNNLYSAYKYLLSIPCTQVSCERVFSKLKIIKTKLRNSLGQELLSNLILMNCERDLFKIINKNQVIDEIACSSEELKTKLMF